MKLYLTATSERGKPATNGGNEYLDIEIKAEKINGIPTRSNIYRLKLSVENNELMAYIHDYSTGQKIFLK